MTDTAKQNVPIIEFKDVHKSFGDKLILDGMSFDVKEGETFVIIGGSGTGKSVSLKLLLGLEPIDSGEIYFRGQNIIDMNEEQLNAIRTEFGMVFQGSALFDSMTIFENIAYPLVEARKYSEEEIEAIVEEKLKIVGLPGVGDLYPADISGGMKKRVGVARAIASDPGVILYDEPTAGLDPANVNRIDQLIQRLQDKFSVTSVLVTHNMDSVYRVADRVALLHDRKIGFIGSLDEFKKTDKDIVRKFVNGELGNE